MKGQCAFCAGTTYRGSAVCSACVILDPTTPRRCAERSSAVRLMNLSASGFRSCAVRTQTYARLQRWMNRHLRSHAVRRWIDRENAPAIRALLIVLLLGIAGTAAAQTCTERDAANRAALVQIQTDTVALRNRKGNIAGAVDALSLKEAQLLAADDAFAAAGCVTPDPAPTPTPTPDPTTTLTPSPDGTHLYSTTGQIVDSGLHVWTLDPTLPYAKILRDGIQASWAYGAGIAYCNQTIFITGDDQLINWYRWDNTYWTFLGPIDPCPVQTSAPSAATLTLAWDAPADDRTGVLILYGTSSQQYTTILDAGAALTATLSNLTSGIVYYISAEAYRVLADGTKEYSPYCPEVSGAAK